jgi:Uma2 family endonuclease
MATTVSFAEQVEVPLNIQSLGDFRRWALSSEFPERGRIDFLAGRIEVDMSPEDLFTHGTLKGEIYGVLFGRVKPTRMGHLFTDRTRVTCPNADLSAEPDIVFISHDAIASGRIRLVPKPSGETGCFVEIEGAPDMVAEIVSDGSENKDTKRLPVTYFKAGIPEFWLIDARGKQLVFHIYQRGQGEYEPVAIAADGFQNSSVFGCRFKLERAVGPDGFWEYNLSIDE